MLLKSYNLHKNLYKNYFSYRYYHALFNVCKTVELLAFFKNKFI
jgi:hypothetical protein